MPPKTAPMPRKATIRTRTPGTESAERVRARARGGAAGATAGWVRALRGEQQAADQGQRGLGDQPGRRVHAGAQRGREHRADDEGELVRHRLEGRRRRHQREASPPEPPSAPSGPAPSARPAGWRHRSGTAAGEQRPQGRVRQRECRQGADGRGVQRGRRAAARRAGRTGRRAGRSAGANRAMETPVTAATAPALPYEPVVCWTSSTMPMVSIAKGCRAAKPGSRKRPRAGGAQQLSVTGRRSVTVDATARAFLPPGSACPACTGAGSAPRAVLLRGTAVDAGRPLQRRAPRPPYGRASSASDRVGRSGCRLHIEWIRDPAFNRSWPRHTCECRAL